MKKRKFVKRNPEPTCRVCGATFKIVRNPDYKKNPYELRYICTDENHKCYANGAIQRCPTCMVSGRN